MAIVSNVTELISQVPLFHLTRLEAKYNCQGALYAKLEGFNPSGSVKDRAALAAIRGALACGTLKPFGTVIQATGGNGGIATAMVCAALGLHAVIIMPDDVTDAHRAHIRAFGGSVILTPAASGAESAECKAQSIHNSTENSFILNQFTNADGCAAHRDGTAEELLAELPIIDYFIAGVGSGATITGCGEKIKMHCPDAKIIAVEPVDSPVLSGGFGGAHNIPGIGAGFVPEVLNTYILDEVIKVKTPDSLELMRRLASCEGLLCGCSSGAALVAAISVAQRDEARGKTLVVILPDTGTGYLDRF